MIRVNSDQCFLMILYCRQKSSDFSTLFGTKPHPILPCISIYSGISINYYNEVPGTGKICSLQRGFVISRYLYIYFTITGVNKSFVMLRTSLYRGY